MQEITLNLGADPDLSRYTAPLDLLVAIPTDHTLPTFIGHWTSPGASAQYFHIYTQLNVAQIELLQDHKPHGALTLPCLGSAFPAFLHRRIVDLRTHSADADLVSKLSASLAGQKGENVTQVQLFGLEALRESDDGWFLPGGKLLWKWAKPQSAYRKSGAWETTLEKAVIDGEWSAGKGMVVLVKSVRDENV